MILYLSLFIYGLTTFISPCSVGLVSAYLTYSLRDSKNRGQGVLVGLSYMLAMGLVFFIFGYALSALIPINLATSKLFYILSGALMIILGANTLGVLDRFNFISSFFYKISDSSDGLRAILIAKFGTGNKFISAFIFGVVISIALGPCSLALVLPAVMMTLFNAPSAIHGGLQLLVFGLGHSLPVLILGVAVSEARNLVSRKLMRFGGTLNKVVGFGLMLLGLYLITNVF